MAGRARGDQPPDAELREGEAGSGERGWAQRGGVAAVVGIGEWWCGKGADPAGEASQVSLLGVTTQVWLLSLPQFWEK